MRRPAGPRIAWPVAAACAVLAHVVIGGQGADATQSARPALIFSHEIHVLGIDLDCVSCHRPETDHGVPRKEDCAGCHDATESKVESDCRVCHLAENVSELRPLESSNRGAGFDAELWRCLEAKYEHALHAKGSGCLDCHPGAQASTSAEDILYPRAESFRCGLCHAEDPCS